MTNALTTNNRRTAPRNAQMLIAPSTIATGKTTNVRTTVKRAAMNLDFEAKYVRHDVHCAGRVLEARKRPRKGMVFSPQFGH